MWSTKFEDGETRDKGNVEESREDENGYEDTDLLALMQRRKRGRSPSPRRRRRARSTEEARRAANRERWTVRGTPSRAPEPVRTRTSSTRSFPPAPWSRSPAGPRDDEVEEQTRRLQPACPLVQVAQAYTPALGDLDPRIRWWTDIVG